MAGSITHAVYPWPTRIDVSIPRGFGSDTVPRASRIPLGIHRLFYGFIGWFATNSSYYETGGISVMDQSPQGKGFCEAFGIEWAGAVGQWAKSVINSWDGIGSNVSPGDAIPVAIRWQPDTQRIKIFRAMVTGNPEMTPNVDQTQAWSVINGQQLFIPESIIYVVGIGH